MTNTSNNDQQGSQKPSLSERLRGMDALGAIIANRFKKSAVQYVFVLPQNDVDYRAYVFFGTDGEIARAKRADVLTRIIKAIYGELEKLGRGARREIELLVEFDSVSRINRDFGGDFYARMN